jgi:ABC-type polysaccharide/polyol phosphate export permease
MAFSAIRGFVTDIVRHREMLVSLTSKEFKIRYKIAVLGFLWTLLNPLLLMLVLSLVLTFISPKWDFLEEQTIPVSAWLLCALIPWNFMAQSLARSPGALLENAALIQKVHFPREMVPLAKVLANSLNFLIALAVLLCFLLALGVRPSVWWIVGAPIVIIGEIVFVVGICLAVSSLNVFFRDVAYLVESLLLVWWWGTPIFYPHNEVVQPSVSELVYRLYMANPMAAVVVSLRQVFLEGRFPDISLVVTLYIAAILSLVIGTAIFRSRQGVIADFV